MVNPYFCYAVTFTVALLTYLLGWSDLYPELLFPLLTFLIVSIVVFFFLGTVTMKSRVIVFRRIVSRDAVIPFYITLFIYGLWAIEFIHAGGIPLLKIILKQSYDYRIFGVPSLHVFVVTFSSFYTVYLIHLYLSSKSKSILVLYFLNLIAALLIYNRGMFLFNLSSSVLLYLVYKNQIAWKQLAAGSVLILALLFVFGMLGSLRVSREGKKSYSNNDFLKIGEASESFRESIIPKEFFWSYIYISSPLANLQHNISTYPVPGPSLQKFGELVNNEIVMDFISKRINSWFGLQPVNDHRIPGPFNVSTIYSRPYCYMGWTGLLIMAFTLVILPWLYFKILPAESPFFLSALVILCTLYLFLAFDNTLRFTGLSFQLVYPIVLHYGIQKFPSLKNYTSTTW
jgi:hypothetical protein